MRNTVKAFTLIELLIVVAIIAILAAIAVPNFLEAQTRAKVARVKNDHRTIATALESYYVDNNSYVEQGDTTTPADPNGVYIQNTTLVWGQEPPVSPVINKPIAFRLSTPIAYIASTQSVFADPFFQGFGKNGTSTVNDTRYYNYSGDYAKGRVYDAAQDGSTANFRTLSDDLFSKNGYHLRSRGPDGDYERRSDGWADYIRYNGDTVAAPPDGGLRAVYEATNGTVSTGDIARFGKTGIRR
jgi:prepilin-type N-terminal cleavage/methylation domain-containing protein